MLSKELKELSESDAYKTLCSRRSKTIWPLTILMLIMYYIYILIIAFKPEIFGQKIGDGHTSLGIVVGLGVILFSFLITGIYVHKANKELEPMTEEIQKSYKGEGHSEGEDA